MRVIGLMSGTSLDGVDAALVDFEGETAAELAWSLEAFRTITYSPERREEIGGAIEHGDAAAISRLHVDLGEWLAEAARAVCAEAGVESKMIDLIASHGQTVWHESAGDGGRGATLQLGSSAVIAERTGIPVVNDFRARDVAAGGQGAPLVPWVDRLLYSLPGRRRVLQNIGGMANLTWLPPTGADRPPVAFDTGPGNALIDAAVEWVSHGRETFDRGGDWASRGRVDEQLLAELLRHPFFERSPPKSTGRETFGRPFVEALVERRRPDGPDDWADLVATLTALTARTIGRAVERWVRPRGLDEVVLTGGGARNPLLREMIEDELAPTPVLGGEAVGIDPEAREAVAFAALGWAFVRRLPANVPEATGASGPRVLGSYTPGAAGGRTTMPL